jgi:uncharacterized protein YbbK (DUF523 family)
VSERAKRDRILVSACLLGARVRYDATAKTLADAILERWRREGRLVALCPEVQAGLPTPRPPVEILGKAGGEGVIAGRARVVEKTGVDVTEAFLRGAEIALGVARAQRCRFALLTEGSPSCGSAFIYDGSFGGVKTNGHGVTAALLEAHGVRVFAPDGIEALDHLILAAEGSQE